MTCEKETPHFSTYIDSDPKSDTLSAHISNTQEVACVKCSAFTTNEEHIVSIHVNNTIHHFSIDKTDTPNVSYAIILSLTDILINHIVSNVKQIDLYVGDLFVYNLLKKNSLSKWKNKNWMSSTGKPIAFVDILSPLHDIILQQKYEFTVHWSRDKAERILI